MNKNQMTHKAMREKINKPLPKFFYVTFFPGLQYWSPPDMEEG